MIEPLPRRSVFRLTEDDLWAVIHLVSELNEKLEVESRSNPLHEATRLLVLGKVSDPVLNEVASRFQMAGYLIEVIPADSRGPAMLRLR